MALTEYKKNHIFKHIALFGLIMFTRYITYIGIAIMLGIWLAVIVTSVLIVADMYKIGPQIGEAVQGFYTSYQNNPTANSIVDYATPYLDSIGGFSLLVFVVGLFFHYTFRNKKFLTLKQSFFLATFPTLIAFIFITINIDNLLHFKDQQATFAQLLTMVIGFIVWLMMCSLILFTRTTDSIVKGLEKSE